MKKLLLIFLFTGLVLGSNAHPGGHAHRSPSHHHGGHHHHRHHTQLTTHEEQKPVH